MNRVIDGKVIPVTEAEAAAIEQAKGVVELETKQTLEERVAELEAAVLVLQGK